jgi:hypothetical protein
MVPAWQRMSAHETTLSCFLCRAIQARSRLPRMAASCATCLSACSGQAPAALGSGSPYVAETPGRGFRSRIDLFFRKEFTGSPPRIAAVELGLTRRKWRFFENCRSVVSISAGGRSFRRRPILSCIAVTPTKSATATGSTSSETTNCAARLMAEIHPL